MLKLRRIDGIRHGTTVAFDFEGHKVVAAEGESIAAALMRSGIVGTRLTAGHGEPRGYFCGMGICWDCAVEVEGVGIVRSCLHAASAGLQARKPRASDGAGGG